MSNLLESTRPDRNANVFASAGSGKTWLLITRICRLLLAGVKPQHILAITFTRKSASEMRARLYEKIAAWAVMPEKELISELNDIEEPASRLNIIQARGLYEKLLFSEQAIRISTFHAFCEEVVRAFPLENELPTLFELTEHTQIFINEAFNRLLQISEKPQEKELHSALQTLYEFCFGFSNTKTALLSFLYACNEWRAYTQHSGDPGQFADRKLAAGLAEFDISRAHEQPDHKQLSILLRRYYTALMNSSTKAHRKHVKQIEVFLKANSATEKLPLDQIKKVFLTSTSDIRKPPKNKALLSALGEDQYEQFLSDHEKLGRSILSHIDQIKQARYLQANHAWFVAGQKLLQLYKEVKLDHGVIDFNDLEWETYRLLQQENHALWVQYKLGERIHHILVDEFQDTNPIQWHLLKPLIESSSEQHQEDFSSLFLVGDIKQSIYRFRGANPDIQPLAADWSMQSINSKKFANDRSWRSAPAVIDCVNTIFSRTSMQPDFPEFRSHECVHNDLWGRVEIHPLLEVDPDNAQIDFRNPLERSRVDKETTAHFHEGEFIADRIVELLESDTPVLDSGTYRSAQYSDMLILTRTRSHLEDLKAGLRSRGIPIQSADTSRLLKYLEIKDMVALLRTLVNPLDDISLVQLLRSPVFAFSDNLLVELRRIDTKNWYEKLCRLSDRSDANHPATVALQKLRDWKNLADRVPVHDLLSRIFTDRDILDRYRSATPKSESAQVVSRLTEFLHLSLEIDSGRYSGISRFLRKIKQINPEISNDNHADINAVNIMTVHGAKGLEAPIVFLADTGPLKSPPEPYKAVTCWPAAEDSPTAFLLSCRKNAMSEAALSLQTSLEQTSNESLNLLYVALTRAKQLLIISGVQAKRTSQDSWHNLICNAVNSEPGQTYVMETNKRPGLITAKKTAEALLAVEYKENLFQPIQPVAADKPVAPAESGATQQGTIIHKCLEILAPLPNLSEQALHNRISLETELEITKSELHSLRREAEKCLQDPDTRVIFDLNKNQRALNEVVITHIPESDNKISIIDRLIISNNLAWIIDYKSDQISAADVDAQAGKHALQLRRYADAVKSVYPKLPIRCSILFTKLPALIDVNCSE